VLCRLWQEIERSQVAAELVLLAVDAVAAA